MEWCSGKNAETGRLGGAGLIDESLTENKITASIIATAIEVLLKIHSAHLLTYLCLTQRRLGLILNFGQPLMRDGIIRVVNQF